MIARPRLSGILENDAVTRGLADPEARILVQWLVDRAELLATENGLEDKLDGIVQQMCRRARLIARFIGLWCHEGQRGAAGQLIAAERLHWPLPTDPDPEPCEVMECILEFEGEEMDRKYFGE